MNYLKTLLIAFSLICCCINPNLSKAATFSQIAFQSILQSQSSSTNSYSYYQSFFNPQTIQRTYYEPVNLNSCHSSNCNYNIGYNLGQSYAYNLPTYTICYDFGSGGGGYPRPNPQPNPNPTCTCPQPAHRQIVCPPNQTLQTQNFTHTCSDYFRQTISCQRQVCRPIPQTCNCPAISEPTNCGINGQSVLENYSFNCPSAGGIKTCQRRVCRVNPPPTCDCPQFLPVNCGINEQSVLENYSINCQAGGTKTCQRPICRANPNPTCNNCPVVNPPTNCGNLGLRTENYSFSCGTNQTRTCQRQVCNNPIACTAEVRFCPNGSQMERDLTTCRWKTETCQSGGICTAEIRFCPNGLPMPRDLITCQWKPETCQAGICSCPPQIDPPNCGINGIAVNESYFFRCSSGFSQVCQRTVCRVNN